MSCIISDNLFVYTLFGTVPFSAFYTTLTSSQKKNLLSLYYAVKETHKGLWVSVSDMQNACHRRHLINSQIKVFHFFPSPSNKDSCGSELKHLENNAHRGTETELK